MKRTQGPQALWEAWCRQQGVDATEVAIDGVCDFVLDLIGQGFRRFWVC